MQITEIREFLEKNPQYFSDKNDIKISDIKSNKQYTFIGECGHKYTSFPKNVIYNNRLHCPICSGKIVLKGYNDLWTVNPDIAKLLLYPDDGYKYTKNSNKKLKWKCPDCGAITEISPNKMNYRLTKCTNCSHVRSYGERFVTELLNQLSELYECEHSFTWSNNKRYDFYLPLKSCIIEVHGKQHYVSSDFSGFGGRTFIEEQINDNYKKELALKNGIQEYVVIKNIDSNKDTLLNNIMQSILPTILNFKSKDINWDICHEYSLTNRTKEICDYYENETKNINDIALHFGCCKNTVKKHLKDGALIGYCSYDTKEAKQLQNKKTSDYIKNTMSKKVLQIYNDEIINEYPSLNEAQRQFKTNKIWECVNKRRTTYHGYTWIYKEDYETKL